MAHKMALSRPSFVLGAVDTALPRGASGGKRYLTVASRRCPCATMFRRSTNCREGEEGDYGAVRCGVISKGGKQSGDESFAVAAAVTAAASATTAAAVTTAAASTTAAVTAAAVVATTAAQIATAAAAAVVTAAVEHARDLRVGSRLVREPLSS